MMHFNLNNFYFYQVNHTKYCLDNFAIPYFLHVITIVINKSFFSTLKVDFMKNGLLDKYS